MWGSFGEINFELLKTPSRLKKETKARLVALTPIEGKTIHQYTGKEPKVVELEILFHNSFCNPEEEAKKLTQLLGSPQPLVVGDTLLGTYALEEVEEEIKTSANGRPISIRMTLKLREV